MMFSIDNDDIMADKYVWYVFTSQFNVHMTFVWGVQELYHYVIMV